jgi:hypothetical protein
MPSVWCSGPDCPLCKSEYALNRTMQLTDARTGKMFMFRASEKSMALFDRVRFRASKLVLRRAKRLRHRDDKKRRYKYVRRATGRLSVDSEYSPTGRLPSWPCFQETPRT